MSTITIENSGPEITATNYWDTELNSHGKLYLSTNAGAFRLLLPQGFEREVKEMATAKLVVISRGPWPAQKLTDALEILFDDGTDDPYCLHLSVESADRLPLDEDAQGEWSLTCWKAPARAGYAPVKCLTRPARYRRVKKLPYLKPWSDT